MRKIIALDVDHSHTILAVKNQDSSQERKSSGPAELRFAGHTLEDDQTLADCGVGDAALLYLKAGLPGVDFGFYNLNREPIQPRREPPNYRRISPGLSFNSKCTDELCDACQDTIYTQKGFGDFNFAF
jgi:hypothetical protein